MKANRLIVLFTSALLLAGCSLPFGQKKTGLQVTANPQAEIFMDNKSLGQTPVIQTGLKSGTYNIKIAAINNTLSSWEGKVTLNPGAITVIDRQLASDPTKSHGYTLSFEKLTNKTATEVNLVSFPDTVSAMIDGAPVGFTPFKSDSIASGAHTFTLTSPGYQDMVIKASVQAGHRLVINAQLAMSVITPTPTLEPSSSVIPTPGIPTEITPLPKQATNAAILKPYVQILATSTGWLRVRAAADPNSAEITKVNPGDKFPYFSTANGWHQIEYQKGLKGWVSASYTKLTQ